MALFNWQLTVSFFSDFVNKDNVETAVKCAVETSDDCNYLYEVAGNSFEKIYRNDMDVRGELAKLSSRAKFCGAKKQATCSGHWQALDEQLRVVNEMDNVYGGDVEKIDTVPGYLAEYSRPHGFAISETQFHIFVLNASRRLFSDRFFTKDFRPAIYTQLGFDWVNNNGPEKANKKLSPFKSLLIRNFPNLAPALDGVTNVFDIWGRDRGSYYSLQWKARDPRDQGFDDKHLEMLFKKM